MMVKLFFVCLLVFCISPLEKCLCKSFPHFLNWQFVFLLLNCKSSLYILGRNLLSDIWLVNIFFVGFWIYSPRICCPPHTYIRCSRTRGPETACVNWSNCHSIGSTEVMQFQKLWVVSTWLRTGEIGVLVLALPQPLPWAHHVIFQGLSFLICKVMWTR